MSEGYATAKAAYEALRAAIDPWARANGYTRSRATQAAWEKALGGDVLSFRFEGSAFVVPAIGNSYVGYVQLEPAGSRGRTIIRQSPFGCCLVQAELDELAALQGAINRRRPPIPRDLKAHLQEDTILGYGLREEYDPAPRYREGASIHFRYHGVQDIRDLAAFVARVLPEALDRFRSGRVAAPVDDTPPHLKPKWLKPRETL